jgi:hypothetical protein
MKLEGDKIFFQTTTRLFGDLAKTTATYNPAFLSCRCQMFLT